MRRFGEPLATRHRLVPDVPFTPLPEFGALGDVVFDLESDSIAADADLDARLDILETDLPALETRVDDLEAADIALDTRLDAVEAQNVTDDSRLDALEAGSAGGPSAFTLPVTAGFAWVNQGTSTITDLAGAYSLLTAQVSGARDVRARVKAAPGTPYTITSMFLLETSVAASFPDAGLLWRESSSGKMVRLCIVAQGGTQPVVFLSKETSPTVFSAAYVLTFPEAYRLVAGMAVISMPVWLRIADDGVNRKSSISFDGSRWFLLHTVARADFITPDQIGFGVQPNATATGMRIFNWVEA